MTVDSGRWTGCKILNDILQINSHKMNDLIKNPIIAFFAGLLALWLIYFLLKLTIGLYWLLPLAFVILYLTNSRFRSSVRTFFTSLFSK